MLSLQETTLKLHTNTGETLQIHGAITVDVTYNDQTVTLPLLVVEGTGPSLMGSDWLTKIRSDWENICNIQANPTWLQKVLYKHIFFFQDALGLVKNTTAKIHVDETAQPRFYRSRIVTYALRGKVNAKIDCLAKSGIIEQVEFSDWAAPIVPVAKTDGSIRICADYKVTGNQAAKLDKYPIPWIDDIFVSLEGGKIFSKLDLAHA